MNDPRILAPAADDLDAVLAFWKVAAEGTGISDDRAGVERLVARDPEALILAERDGELVGTVIAGFDGWRCHLYRLAVHPNHRRGDVGSTLPAAATRWCCSATRPRTMHGGPRGTRRRSTGAAG